MCAQRGLDSKVGPPGSDAAAEVAATPAAAPPPFGRRVCTEACSLFQLAWPLTVATVTGFAPRVFMLAMVGHLPNGAVLVGAAGIGSMYSNFAHLMLIRSSTFGASPLLSQAFGAGNHARVGIVLMRILAIHAVMIVLLSLPLTAIAGPLLVAVGQPAFVASHAQQFIWVRLLGLPGVIFREDVTTFLSAQRCVRLPMIANAGSSLLQVALCFALTRWLGYVGAPLAMTLVELSFAAVLCVAAPLVLRRQRLRSWPRWRDAAEARRGWGEILSKGGPATIMITSEWFGWECTLFLASGLCVGGGVCAVVDAIPICTTIFVLQFLLNFGWGQAVCNRVGNLLGAGRGADARFSAGVAWLMAASSTSCVGTVVIVMRRPIARLFVDGGSDEAEAVLEVTAGLIPITTAYSMLATLAPGWSQQVLFGLGARLKLPAAINFFAFFGVGIPGGAVLAYRFGLGVHGIWLGLVAAIVLIIIGQYLYLALTVDWHEAARDAQRRAQQKTRRPDGRDGSDLGNLGVDLGELESNAANGNGEDGVGLAAADSAKAQQQL
jgi:MATE family multidrug resistance protein